MTMNSYTRHNEIIILAQRAGIVDATYFNQVQTALKRIGSQIRLSIPKLSHLDLILQTDAWIVVDRVLHDIPVVAWTNFQTRGRDNLHEPVDCEIRLYHFAAGMILKRTLDAMEVMLGQSLAEQNKDQSEAVLPFNLTDQLNRSESD